jgi:hypothetical protein
MDGSATLTIVASSTTRNCAPHSSSKISIPRRVDSRVPAPVPAAGAGSRADRGASGGGSHGSSFKDG